MQINQIESALEHFFFPGLLAGKVHGSHARASDEKINLRQARAVTDSVSISQDAIDAARRVGPGSGEDHAIATIPLLGSTDTVELRPGEAEDAEDATETTATTSAATAATEADESDEAGTREDRLELTDEDQARVRELQQTDREVRAHENAHVPSGGSVVAGGPSYSFTTEPDGRRYAVGGEVPIRAGSASSDPRTRALEARQVISAALAPAHPSGADRAIAAQAARELAQALVDDRLEESQPTEEGHSQGKSDAQLAQNAAGEATATDPAREIGAVEGDGHSQAISGASAVTATANGEDRSELKLSVEDASKLRSPAGGLFGFATPSQQRGATVDVLA